MPPPLVMKTALTHAAFGLLILPYKFGSAMLLLDCIIHLYFADVSPNSTKTSRIFTVSVPEPLANLPTTLNIYNYTGGANMPVVYYWNHMMLIDTSKINMTPITKSIDPPLINGPKLYVKHPPLMQTTITVDG